MRQVKIEKIQFFIVIKVILSNKISKSNYNKKPHISAVRIFRFTINESKIRRPIQVTFEPDMEHLQIKECEHMLQRN